MGGHCFCETFYITVGLLFFTMGVSLLVLFYRWQSGSALTFTPCCGVLLQSLSHILFSTSGLKLSWTTVIGMTSRTIVTRQVKYEITVNKVHVCKQWNNSEITINKLHIYNQCDDVKGNELTEIWVNTAKVLTQRKRSKLWHCTKNAEKVGNE